MPLPSSRYTSGPVSPQQLNTDLYGSPLTGASGVGFHASRPLLSETVMSSGTAYTLLAPQTVRGAGLQAYTAADTTALFGAGADNPGTASLFSFNNNVAASGGAAGNYGGWWLTWNFPVLEDVTVPPGGVGAGMITNGVFTPGVFQYGDPGDHSTPYHLDVVHPAGTTPAWGPAFWWLTPSTPVIFGNDADTAGQTTRMGFLWQATGNATTLPGTAVPAVAAAWGTVTSAMLNGMGSALTFLNNPPTLRASSSSGQRVPSATITGLQFGTPDLDPYGGWTAGTTSSYFAPLPGLYLFSPTTVWGTASANGIRWSGITATGTAAAVYQGPAYAPSPVGPGTTGTGLAATSVARVFALNAGDRVQPVGLQNSGGTLALYTGYASRFAGAYLCPVAPAGTTVSYTPPVTGFRFQAGALQGAALEAALNARIGNDVGFLLNRPYFTGIQGTSQSGLANNSGFHQVTIDTLGAPPRFGSGDNYGGWQASSHYYAAQVPGWYLAIADLYATPPSATTAILTAGIFCSSSGGITPTATPDWYQQVYYPVSTGGPPPGATAIGLYYLLAGEFLYPMLQARNWGGTWGTYSAAPSTVTHSQFSCFWMSE